MKDLVIKKESDLRIPFTWKDRRSVLLDRFLYVPPLYGLHDQWTALPWFDPQIFGNEKPVVLEYCSGNGQWICKQAQENSRYNWVALDKRFDRARKIWARMHREKIDNLYILCGDAEILTQYYIPSNSLKEIFVNFPDPWPKARHAKHRLLKGEFLHKLAKVVQPGGRAAFVTDDFPYASQMLAEIGKCPEWRFLLPPPYYTLNQHQYGSSFFSDLWRKKGRDIHFIFCERICAE